MKRIITVNGSSLSLEDVVAVAEGHCLLHLDRNPDFQSRIDKGADFVDMLIAKNSTLYGVTTGYGENVSVAVPPGLTALLPDKLVRYHGVGLGQPFSPVETRAIMVARLISLARGYSGVSFALLVGLHALMEHDIIPVIPEEGSVGASGDLTPLSYVAAALCGERTVWHDHRLTSAAVALASAGMRPYSLRPKEALAIMNGTAVMTALACLNYVRAEYLVRVCARITALMVMALDGNPGHFAQGLFAVKPFSGVGAVAGLIRNDLAQQNTQGKNLQDRYSIRCAPHVIGVLADCLSWYRDFIETELNSSNDNPIIDIDIGMVYHGGHFYGGHICHVMDSMKTNIANLADLVDRQIALLVDPKMNAGLPANLSGAIGDEAVTEHGLKALQITASACTVEALKLCMPASVFSRSTESHNQDKVSLGTIAARDCRRVLELTEQVAACGILAACQGVELRLEQQGRVLTDVTGDLGAALAWTRTHSVRVGVDRSLEGDLRRLIERLRSRDASFVSTSTGTVL